MIGYHVVSSLILRILASRDVEFAGVTNWATVRLKPTALTPVSSGYYCPIQRINDIHGQDWTGKYIHGRERGRDCIRDRERRSLVQLITDCLHDRDRRYIHERDHQELCSG